MGFGFDLIDRTADGLESPEAASGTSTFAASRIARSVKKLRTPPGATGFGSERVSRRPRIRPWVGVPEASPVSHIVHTQEYGQYGSMKTTIEIQDRLLERAKRFARRSRQPLRAVVEEGLRRVLDDDTPPQRFRLEDASVGERGAPDPLEQYTWQDLRAEIYGAPERR